MRIRKVTTAGVISTVAASGGEPATPALFASPQGVARDSEGNLYVAETGSCLIRKITSEGVISTVAGNLSMSSVGPLGEGAPYTNCFYGGDGGPATSAHLANPIGIAIDSAGNLYIADSSWGYEYAASNRIRKVTVAGVISTVAGGGHGGDGGLATSAYLIQPTGVAVDSAGNIYIADSGNSRIRKVNTAGIISSVAGNGTSGYSGDGEQATQAQLNNPIGVALDSAGNIYIADSSNNRVRKVSSAGIINTVAGNGTSGFSGDGEQATQAQLNYPTGVAVDFAGSLYIADSNNNRIRKVTTILSPTIITALVSSITQTTASGGGNVTSDGGASIIARGVCWSTSVNPTTSDVCTADGTGTGTFFSSITGLTANTSYHVRAYAMNIAGTAYGADAPFTALPLDPDFRIGTGSGGSFSAVTTAGSRAVYNLAVTGKNNFSGSVTFACSGLPAATACSFSSNPLNVSGTSTAPFTITISTTASTSSTNIPKGVDHLPWNGSAAVVLCLGGLATIAGMSRRRRLSFALLALCSIGIVGCRGGSKKKTTPVQGTPAGTYSVVLTAASGGISHNSNLTLIVQ
jgi:sugar lactone lactonase YvrE